MELVLFILLQYDYETNLLCLQLGKNYVHVAFIN